MTTDKSPSPNQPAVDALDHMVDRLLSTSIAVTDLVSAGDVLAWVITGMPPGPDRDAAVLDAARRLAGPEAL